MKPSSGSSGSLDGELLRALADPVEDLSSVPSTHTVAPAPVPGDLAPSPFAPGIQAVCIHVGTILLHRAGVLAQSVKSTSCFPRGSR